MSEVYTIVSAIVVILLVVGGGIFIWSEVIGTKIEEKTNIEELNVKVATRLVEHCFSQGSDAISTEFLDESIDKNICDICELCTTKIRAKVEDLEEPAEWDLGYNDGAKFRHKMFINILSGNEIHPGRLYVNI